MADSLGNGEQRSSAAEELERLRRRVAQLEQELTAYRQDAHTAQRDSDERLDSILNSLDDIVWSQSAATFEVLYLSPATERIYGRPVADFMNDAEMWLRVIYSDDRARVDGFFPAILETGQAEVEYRIVRSSGEIRWLHDRGHVVRDSAGTIVRLDGIASDVTERKRAEAEREERQRQAEVIRMQEALLRELSTPLIPISETVLVMPLIGSIDSARAQRVLETLLQGIAGSGAQVAILDITGVSVVDTQVANALVRAAQAVKLLGAQVVLTGIRPEVAQTLVGLGTDLGAVVTHSTLQSGIAFALQRRGARQVFA
jgi:rsbT co-antagonist protein RsbR